MGDVVVVLMESTMKRDCPRLWRLRQSASDLARYASHQSFTCGSQSTLHFIQPLRRTERLTAVSEHHHHYYASVVAMSLSGSLAKFKGEIASATTRNIGQSRPPGSSSNSARATPKPSAPTATTATTTADATKRTHDAAFQMSSAGSGSSLMTQVNTAVNYLKGKNPQALAFLDIINYLSLPTEDAKSQTPLIRKALQGNERVEFVPKAQSANGKDSFKYRPTHPVTNAEELKNYLARQSTAQGILVKELKDGWPNCVPAIDALEKENAILVTRQTKDNAPKMVWPNSPSYHVHIDDDFREFWNKTKLPPTETEIRSELEKAGIVPTSQVKEVKKTGRVKERKKPTRRGGMKTTNKHMAGILKDYAKK